MCTSRDGKPYRGLSGARNWELIQPFQRVLSTCTQSPCRLVAVNGVPLGAVPRTERVSGRCGPDVYAGTLQEENIPGSAPRR